MTTVNVEVAGNLSGLLNVTVGRVPWPGALSSRMVRSTPVRVVNVPSGRCAGSILKKNVSSSSSRLSAFVS